MLIKNSSIKEESLINILSGRFNNKYNTFCHRFWWIIDLFTISKVNSSSLNNVENIWHWVLLIKNFDKLKIDRYVYWHWSNILYLDNNWMTRIV